MSLSHLTTDDAGPILFTMDSNSPSLPSTSPSFSSSPSLSKTLHSPPPLPKRNARRASRFLDTLLDSSVPTTATTPTTVTVTATNTLKSSPKMTCTAHEVYLSSEEDASSPSDVSDSEDANEYDYDSDTVQYIAPATIVKVLSSPAPAPAPTKTEEPACRYSHEDKARLVSVVYAGKPLIVDLAVERAARRSSVSARSNWSDSSASRPSTSAGSASASAPSTAVSSVDASPQRPHQHKRNSSGSMLASLRVRKAMEMETIADAPTLSSSSSSSNETDAVPRRSMRSYTTTSSRSPPLSSNTALIAAAAAANAAAAAKNKNATASSLSLSPRTSTFSHSSLLRGVTRSLTLSRRGSRRLSKDRDASFTLPQLSPAAQAQAQAQPPLPGQLPGVAHAPTDGSILRRKSLAISVASLGLGGGGGDRAEKSVPPMPRTPEEHMFTTSISPALRRASTTGTFLAPAPAPVHRVLSKKNGNGGAAASPSTSFFSRRRSVRLA